MGDGRARCRSRRRLARLVLDLSPAAGQGRRPHPHPLAPGPAAAAAVDAAAEPPGCVAVPETVTSPARAYELLLRDGSDEASKARHVGDLLPRAMNASAETLAELEVQLWM